MLRHFESGHSKARPICNAEDRGGIGRIKSAEISVAVQAVNALAYLAQLTSTPLLVDQLTRK